MKRRAIIALILLALIAAGFAISSLCRSREPKYDGRRFSEWITEAVRANQLLNEGKLENDDPKFRQVHEAFRHMGTNALPFLLDLVRIRDSRLKLAATEFAINHLHYDPPWLTPEWRLCGAMSGFAALDPQDLRPAVPALTDIALNDSDRDVRVAALLCVNVSKLDAASKRVILKKAAPSEPMAVGMLQKLDRYEAWVATNAASAGSQPGVTGPKR